MNDLIKCPICGKELKALGTHWVRAHKEIPYYEYLRNHPEVKKLSDSLKKVRADHVNKQRENDNFRKSQSLAITKWLKDKHANDPEFRENSINNLRTDRSHSYGTLCEHTLYNGETVKLRSKLEKSIANKLDKLGIEYTYEERLDIKYNYKGTVHEYIPDFRIINTNIVIEVKPEWFHNDELTQIKKLSAENKGYKVLLIGYKTNIKDIVSSSSTIESIASSEMTSE